MNNEADKSGARPRKGGTGHHPKPVLCDLCTNDRASAAKNSCDATRIEQQRGEMFECSEFVPRYLDRDSPIV